MQSNSLNLHLTWSTGVGKPNLHMDARDGGSISLACSRLGLMCTKNTRKCMLDRCRDNMVPGTIDNLYDVYQI